VSEAPSHEYLAIADISGYTSYVAGVELDHAQDILSDLTVTVVEGMAPFGLAKLEGDAAFMTATEAAFDGSSLQDSVEGTYVAFQRRLRDIKQASTCECDACIRIPDLDLKIVIHSGVVGRQRLMGLVELVGSDVILVHRLLKNRVREDVGMAAYALYTQAAVDAAAIDPTAQGLVRHTEETDVAGVVVGWLRDLGATWQELSDRPRLTIPAERTARSWKIEFDAPMQVVFEHLSSPRHRLSWDAGIDSIDEDSGPNDGRRGVGTTNHCMHGEDAIVERILDWRPPEYWLTETTVPIPSAPRFVKSEVLEPLEGGRTRVLLTIGSIEGRLPADDAELFGIVAGNVATAIDNIRTSIAETMADTKRRAEGAQTVPKRGDRHLTAPIKFV
jgi:hypothetical protein